MSKKVPTHWGPRWSRWVGRGLARGLWNTEVRGKRNIPKNGAGIVVVNHVGFIDGPVVHGVIPRLNYFLIRADMFKGPLKPLLHGAAQIPVEGDGRSALAKGLAVLRRGDIVGVFPEGTRGGGTAEQVHGGAAWLAVQSGAPIIPTALLGTRLPGPGAVYMSQSLRFTAPVRIGVTVHAMAEVIELIPEKKRARLRTWCTVADAVVVEGEALVMVPGRG